MPDIPADKLRLHLLAEKAIGLSGVPVGKRRKPAGTGGSASKSVTPPNRAPALNTAPASNAAPAAPSARPTPAATQPAPPSPPSPPTPPPPPTASTPPPAPTRRATTARDPVGPSVAPAALFGPPPGEPLPPSTVPPEERRLRLEQLDANEVRGCTRCRLCETRTNTVFGEGDPNARLMFVGEGPGENEDLQGRPFVGKAGDLLEKQITAMGLTRDQVFIANVVKCRPPENRTPLPDEVATCTPYLVRQIEIIRPDVIVTLGLPATRFMLGDDKIAMGKARMGWHTWRGIPVRPTYHPAYLLRNYTPATRKLVWSDLQEVMARLGLR